MCGIAGLVWDDGRPPGAADLEAMAAALKHRGPDSTGTGAVGPIGLAATRLAIVDLGSTGEQPIIESGAGLVFNGELYNHRALRAELRGAGVTLKGTSDTEVLFHLLRVRGVRDVLPRLRGMFAFAFAGTDGSVHLVRDRLGIKPLHWTARAGRVAWASEVKGLAAVVPLRPDPARALFGVLSLADRWSSRTVFTGVHQVAPGEVVSIAPGGRVSQHQWYRLTDDIDPALARDLDAADSGEIQHRLEALLEAAVAAAATTADAPLGSLVSGGVDSSVIAALASAVDPGHRLFSADVSGPHSERAAARSLAGRLGKELATAPFEPAMVLDDWARCTWHNEAPVVTHLNALPLARVAAVVHASGTRGVLTGEGADELLAGYPTMAARPHLDLLRLPYRALKRLYSTIPGLVEQVLPGGPSQEGYLAAVSDDFETARLALDAEEHFTHLPPDEARHAVTTYMALQGHLRTLLHRNDRMGMQEAVECRFPFLDEDVVRFGLNLPRAHKVTRTWHLHDRKHPFLLDKAPLRHIAEDQRLPGARRPKAGFPTWGHSDMTIDAGLFRHGWLADALELSPAALEHMVEVESPYYVAKLASVEVFGRVFDCSGGIDGAREHIARHVQMTRRPPAGGSPRTAVPWTRWRSPV
jgi:asparagine synthase (glutamine-hydrolysing)